MALFVLFVAVDEVADDVVGFVLLHVELLVVAGLVAVVSAEVAHIRSDEVKIV